MLTDQLKQMIPGKTAGEKVPKVPPLNWSDRGSPRLNGRAGQSSHRHRLKEDGPAKHLRVCGLTSRCYTSQVCVRAGSPGTSCIRHASCSEGPAWHTGEASSSRSSLPHTTSRDLNPAEGTVAHVPCAMQQEQLRSLVTPSPVAEVRAWDRWPPGQEIPPASRLMRKL